MSWSWIFKLPLIEVAAGIAAVAAACAAHKLNRLTDTIHRTSIRPQLVFSRRDTKHWQLENIGHGPAVNVRVRERKDDTTWRPPVQLYAIAAHCRVDLEFMKFMNAFQAVYEDVDGHPFISEAADNLTRTTQLNRYPEDCEDWRCPESEYDARRNHSNT